VRRAAQIYRRVEKSGGINLFANDLKDTWNPEWRGRALSAPSRSAIERIWRNRRINRSERRTAFLIWCQTPTRDELVSLAALEADPVLADVALRTRLAKGDQSAVSLLKQRIWNSERGTYWWYDARGVGLNGLHDDVLRYLDWRRIKQPNTGTVTDADSIIAELLMDERDEFAVKTIIANWDQLHISPLFVQAALYLATPETVALAGAAITNSEEPEKMLQYIDMRWGIRTNGRVGVTDHAQLRALEPYYAHMDEMRLISFFEASNELGELSWREKHIDPLIAKSQRGYCTADKQHLFASLDREVSNYLTSDLSWFAIDRWFERREEELWERRELLSTIAEWACIRASEHAVALLCETLLNFGERPDLALFDSLPQELQVSCSDRIANCVYGVQQRSLSRRYQLA